MKNGDCTGNGIVNIGDALRLANNVSYPGNPGVHIEIIEENIGEAKLQVITIFCLRAARDDGGRMVRDRACWRTLLVVVAVPVMMAGGVS